MGTGDAGRNIASWGGTAEITAGMQHAAIVSVSSRLLSNSFKQAVLKGYLIEVSGFCCGCCLGNF